MKLQLRCERRMSGWYLRVYRGEECLASTCGAFSVSDIGAFINATLRMFEPDVLEIVVIK